MTRYPFEGLGPFTSHLSPIRCHESEIGLPDYPRDHWIYGGGAAVMTCPLRSKEQEEPVRGLYERANVVIIQVQERAFGDLSRGICKKQATPTLHVVLLVEILLE